MRRIYSALEIPDWFGCVMEPKAHHNQSWGNHHFATSSNVSPGFHENVLRCQQCYPDENDCNDKVIFLCGSRSSCRIQFNKFKPLPRSRQWILKPLGSAIVGRVDVVWLKPVPLTNWTSLADLIRKRVSPPSKPHGDGYFDDLV
ncbi:hypothetical protein CDAR_454771 [Caerostris darwini]|uniref:Uncharacterized protein n=1 Tax=Caerostris darwini TaxID=1538125 RepID=A0AAV4TV17_9ARAC|nr:hypothetical protein CDAR_454771 [Caerostris darwini]